MKGKIPRKNILQLTLVLFVSACLTGCGMAIEAIGGQPPDDAIIADGSYERIQRSGSPPDTLAPDLVHAVIDRNQQKVTFALEDGSTIEATLETVASTWAQGCPMNWGSTKMEVLPLAEAELELNGVHFEQPVLVATCPFPPSVFVLREYGEGLSDHLPASACEGWNGAKCIYFSLMQFTLQGQVVDYDTGQGIQDAVITFTSLARQQTFTGSYHVQLPAGLLDFEISAPGYQGSHGTIEVTGDSVILGFLSGVYVDDLGKAISVEDPAQPVEFDFPLARK